VDHVWISRTNSWFEFYVFYRGFSIFEKKKNSTGILDFFGLFILVIESVSETLIFIRFSLQKAAYLNPASSSQNPPSVIVLPQQQQQQQLQQLHQQQQQQIQQIQQQQTASRYLIPVRYLQ
jgi:hypothetical protein